MSSILSKLINLAGNITGTLGATNGGTGLAALGTGNQILGVNSGASANEYKTLSTGTTGSDFAIANSAGGVAFNLPDAGSSARGAVTTGAQTLAGAKTFSSAVVVGGNSTGDSNYGTIASVSLGSYYAGSFSYTFNGQGFAASQAVTILYTKIGRLVTLEIPQLSATGQASGVAFITGTAALPTNLVPQGTVTMPCTIINSNATLANPGEIYVNSSSVIRFYRSTDETTTFTNNATIGWARTTISFITAT